MQYLNIDVDFFNHPKTVRFCCELGGHRSEVLPVRLWAHTAKYHPEDCYLKGYSPAAIAKVLGWKEDAEKLVQALLNCGFLEQKKDGFIVHDFSEHNGHLALYKERGRIAAEARWKKLRQSGAGEAKEAAKTDKTKKAPAKEAFTDDQIREIRVTLSKAMKHSLLSVANETAWNELKRKLDNAFKRKMPANPFNYALVAARNCGALS
jgi:hypothetical protein